VEFLLLDRLFPRSVVHALTTADACLAALDLAPGSQSRRLSVHDDARRLLGRARTELEYRPLADVLADPVAEMDRLQQAVSTASEAVSQRCFPRASARAWVRELS
jgi:uncharacterized alpha-E superfamily protein